MNPTTLAATNKLEIITTLYHLTCEMSERCNDADFLIQAVDKRQELMDCYNNITADEIDAPTEQSLLEIKRMVREIIRMDVTISATLEKHKSQAKGSLASSTNQNRMLGYVNQAVSSSGSYMDYKK